MNMRSHELPPEAEGLEPEAAQAEINKVLADSRENPDHPMMRRDHPQHRDFLSRVQRLQKAANPGPEPAEPLEDFEREEIEAEIAKIERVPGFVTGEMKRADRKAHDRLVARRSELYARLHPEPSEAAAEDDSEGDAEGDQENTSLQDVLREQAAAEMARLVELGFEETPIPADVQPHTVTGLKMQRLLAEGNERELKPLIEGELKRLGADTDPDLQRGAIESIIRWIHEENERRYGEAKT